MAPCSPISRDAFQRFVAAFIGLPVTHPWFSDHAILYLEVGAIVGHSQRSGRPQGEKHIFVGYAWEGVWPGGEAFDRHDTGIKDELLGVLPNLRIEELQLARSGELLIRFATGLCLRTLTLAVDGPSEPDDAEPDWELFDSASEPSYLP